MVKKTKNILKFKYKRHKITVLLDKILIFRFIRGLHGRFWGIMFIFILLTGLAICFAIKPELLSWSTPFSEFGNDVRTAPYFAGTMFFAAYALWRWKNYLKRTLRRSRPIIGLLTLTIIGFYLVALMPISIRPWPYRIHFFGVILAGGSIAVTVVIDTLLSKTRKNQKKMTWQLMRLFAFMNIIIGGYITFGSSPTIGWYHLSLLGEVVMLIGYGTWIIVKTYQGEVGRSILSKQLKKIVLVD
jgi:hypothetical protein